MQAAEAGPKPSSACAIVNPFEAMPEVRHAAVAVSGGSDSIALLHLAARWALARQVKLTVLTVDHGLRPASAAEAVQVAAWAGALGIAHVTLVWDGPKPAAGLQAKARQVRYDLMASWCRAHGADVILTGHTKNDQAETVMMRTRRTRSAESLASIHPCMTWQGVPVVRPLLSLKRNMLRDILHHVSQPWIDDPSNDNTMFERVRVRHQLRDEDVDTYAAIADQSLQVANRHDELAVSFLKRSAGAYPHGYFTVDREGLLQLDLGTQDNVLRRLFAGLGRGPAERSERLRLLTWLCTPDLSRRTLGGAVFAKRKATILVMREPARIAMSPAVVPPSGVLHWDGRFEINAPPGMAVVPFASLPSSSKPGPTTAGLTPIADIPRTVLDAMPVLLVDSDTAMAEFETAGNRLFGRFRAFPFELSIPQHLEFVPMQHMLSFRS